MGMVSPAGHAGSGRVTTGSGAREGTRADARSDGPAEAGERPAATSPAVGIFRPQHGITGSEVRAGDRLGAVDMLGVPQEIVAPVDGVVGDILAEPGDGVEYGQPLFAIEPRALVPAGQAIPVDAEAQVAAPAGERF
jgi:biotin carboxyl carrier protein